MKPIDMILYCPNCGMQHIDAPEPPRMEQVPSRFAQMHSFQLAPTWDNPPHKSHLCHGCRCVWRPADVATNGVAELKTSGKDDTWPAVHNDEVRAMPPSGVEEPLLPCGLCGTKPGPGDLVFCPNEKCGAVLVTQSEADEYASGVMASDGSKPE